MVLIILSILNFAIRRRMQVCYGAGSGEGSMTFEGGIAMMGFVNQTANQCESNVSNVNKVHRFVVLESAIEALQLARHQLVAFNHLPVIEQRKHNYYALVKAVESAHKLIDKAFSSELLPVILGGSWCMSRFISAHLPDQGMRNGELIVDYALTANSAEYRRLTNRGKPSSVFAVVSKACNLFDGDVVKKSSRMAAIGLVQQMKRPHLPSPDFGVWIRRLFESDDAVVVMAHHLLPENASKYDGFICLAPAAN
jgi:hypothetical protein